jgi:hypothetical protein
MQIKYEALDDVVAECSRENYRLSPAAVNLDDMKSLENQEKLRNSFLSLASVILAVERVSSSKQARSQTTVVLNLLCHVQKLIKLLDQQYAHLSCLHSSCKKRGSFNERQLAKKREKIKKALTAVKNFRNHKSEEALKQDIRYFELKQSYRNLLLDPHLQHVESEAKKWRDYDLRFEKDRDLTILLKEKLLSVSESCKGGSESLSIKQEMFTIFQRLLQEMKRQHPLDFIQIFSGQPLAEDRDFFVGKLIGLIDRTIKCPLPVQWALLSEKAQYYHIQALKGVRLSLVSSSGRANAAQARSIFTTRVVGQSALKNTAKGLPLPVAWHQ